MTMFTKTLFTKTRGELDLAYLGLVYQPPNYMISITFYLTDEEVES